MPGRTDHTLERKWIITRLPYVLSIFNWIQTKQSNTCFFFCGRGNQKNSDLVIAGVCSRWWDPRHLCVCTAWSLGYRPFQSDGWHFWSAWLWLPPSPWIVLIDKKKTNKQTNHNLPLKLFLPNQTNSKTLTASRTFITYVHKWKQHGVIQFQVRLH